MTSRVPFVVLLQFVPAVAGTAFLLSQGRSREGLAALCAVSVICAFAYVVRRCGLFSFVGLFVTSYTVLYLMYPVTALLLDLPVPSDGRIGKYAFLTVVGLALFVVSHALTLRRVQGIAMAPLQPRRVAIAFWLSVVPLMLAVGLVAVNWPSLGSLLAATRVDIKEQSSGVGTMAQYLWVVGSVAVTLGPLYLRRHPVGWIPFLALVGVTGATGFLAFRTRSVLVLLLGSLAMGWWINRQIPRSTADGVAHARLRAPRVWRMALLALVGIVALSYVRVARGQLEDRGLAGLADVDLGAALLHNLNQGDLAFTPVVFDVLDHVPAKEDYLKGQSYYRLLFVPVPRAVWPEKPFNTQRVVASWLHPDLRVQTTPPGIQGDLYINFGLAGVLGFLFFGFVFGRLDRWDGLGRLLAIGGGFVPVFHLVRGGFTNPMLMLAALVMATSVAAAVAEGRLRLSMGRLVPRVPSS